ncbi:GH116 family glycosyl-hydrolase [Microbacterium sp. B35-04]|uniref:GH116 family glycosyl-hydrolase n=1 Tax=Microbacterium sp. B35-04 TaxID=1961716 RepID=UPI0013D6F7C6|nr:GH116 family glycosyl-hydrolase [Microbacterium sp. B35-04]
MSAVEQQEKSPTLLRRHSLNRRLAAVAVAAAVAATVITPGLASPPSARAGQQAGQSALGDAAYQRPLGVIGSTPCSAHDWQLCAGDTSAPDTVPYALGNPMAQPGLGIPLGGLGAGSFMINQAGTFGPWNMGGSTNSNYEKRILPQAAIHIREQQPGRTATTKTLAVNSSEFGSVLPAWSTLDAGSGTYSALYPFGRIDYADPVPSTSVSTSFWTPIVAGDDESSSQPVAYFEVELTNETSKTTKVSTMFTFPNAPAHVASTVQNTPSPVASVRTGYTSHETVDHRNKITGITLGASSPSNTADSQNSEWTTAVQDEPGQRVTYATSWNADGDGSDIYAPFSATGRLPNGALDGSNSASALAVDMNLKPHQTETVRFVLAWDFPQITFGTAGDTSWMRRYTSFYGGSQDAQNNYIAGSYPGNQGFAIAARNLARVDEAAEAVARWWKPVAFDDTVSPAIRMAALNELGQLSFNGSFWESGLVSSPYKTDVRPGSAVPGTHLFHTVTGGGWADAGETDVQGQMAIALRELFPSTEAAWVRATSEMIAQDPNGRVPGSPGFNPPVGNYIWWQLEAPWLLWEKSTSPAAPEATFFDRPVKYLIRAYGAYSSTGDDALLRDIYPAMLRLWTHDVVPRIPQGDTLPTEAAVFASTYDVMGQSGGVHGVYTSGLYILAAEIMAAATEDAQQLGIAEASLVDVDTLKQTAATARAAYEKAFWTGSYYTFTDAGERSTDVFVDVLWPQHVAEQLGLADVNPPERVAEHLTNTFDQLTQLKDSTGHMLGAPNLVPNGGKPYPVLPNRPRELGFQAAEVWTGTNFEFAGTLIQEGRRLGRPDLVANGNELAEGVVHQIYSPAAPAGGAFAFNTPEGWNGYDPTTYRAAYYARAIAAWDLYASARQ